MKFAVLPVTVSDKARATTFNRQWIVRACESVRRYFQDQSGQRQNLEFTVFDWCALPITSAQWMTLGGNVSDTVNPMISSNPRGMAPQNINLGGFERFIYIIDDGVSRNGSTENNETRIGAEGFDPAILAHEICHIFGPDDSYKETDAGQERYEGLFCIMGYEDGKFSFKDPGLVSLPDGAGVDRVDCGPGMCVTTLLRTGWMNLSHGVQINGITTPWANSTVRIRALDGAPDAAVVSPVFAWFDDGERYFVEYRLASSRWDHGLPPSQNGWLVVYRAPIGQPPMTLEVASFPVSPGKSTAVDAAPDNFYIFGAGPLRIAVLSCDPNAGTVEIIVKRQKGKPPQHDIPFLEIMRSDRSVLWTPKAGWRVLPLDSDLAKVLESVGELDHIQELARITPRRFAATLSAAAVRQGEELQGALAAFNARLADANHASGPKADIVQQAAHSPNQRMNGGKRLDKRDSLETR
jgi:hypothetical protein